LLVRAAFVHIKKADKFGLKCGLLLAILADNGENR
jgi:hypothetical protein